MNKFLFLCLGGAVGTGARYLVSGWMVQWLGSSFPFGTIAVNVLGSFLIGIFMHFGLETTLLSPILRVVLTTGLMGGFTTYSSFNYETLQYFQDGEFFRGFLYMAVMVFLCLGSGWLGLLLARRLLVLG